MSSSDNSSDPKRSQPQRSASPTTAWKLRTAAHFERHNLSPPPPLPPHMQKVYVDDPSAPPRTRPPYLSSATGTSRRDSTGDKLSSSVSTANVTNWASNSTTTTSASTRVPLASGSTNRLSSTTMSSVATSTRKLPPTQSLPLGYVSAPAVVTPQLAPPPLGGSFLDFDDDDDGGKISSQSRRSSISQGPRLPSYPRLQEIQAPTPVAAPPSWLITPDSTRASSFPASPTVPRPGRPASPIFGRHRSPDLSRSQSLYVRPVTPIIQSPTRHSSPLPSSYSSSRPPTGRSSSHSRVPTPLPFLSPLPLPRPGTPGRSSSHGRAGTPFPHHPSLSRSGSRTPRPPTPEPGLIRDYRQNAGISRPSAQETAPFESRFDPSFLELLRVAVEKDNIEQARRQAAWQQERAAKAQAAWKQWDQQADPNKSWAEVVSHTYQASHDKQRDDEIDEKRSSSKGKGKGP